MLLWAKEQNEEKSPTLTRFTEHFNNVSQWCVCVFGVSVWVFVCGVVGEGACVWGVCVGDCVQGVCVGVCVRGVCVGVCVGCLCGCLCVGCLCGCLCVGCLCGCLCVGW